VETRRRAGDTVANGSEYEAAGRRNGNVVLQSPDRHGKPLPALSGGAHIVVDGLEPFTFKPRTASPSSLVSDKFPREQVIAAGPEPIRWREIRKTLRLDHAG